MAGSALPTTSSAAPALPRPSSESTSPETPQPHPPRDSTPIANPSSKPAPQPKRIPRSSTQSRIDEILDEARQRSVAVKSSATSPAPMAQERSLAQRESLALSESDGISPAEMGESSADESTAILRREEAKKNNYQATNTVRSRNSASTVSLRRSAERRPEPVGAEVEDDGEVHDETWWKKQLAKYGSIELENKGSVARDHLALERTYLAWLRTSLAFASIGIAITQLFRLNTSIAGGGSDPYQHLRQLGKPLGATFLGISIVVLFIGFHRYFESQHWIIRGKFPASRGSITLVSAIAFALMVTSLVVVLVVEPGSYEKRRRV